MSQFRKPFFPPRRVHHSKFQCFSGVWFRCFHNRKSSTVVNDGFTYFICGRILWGEIIFIDTWLSIFHRQGENVTEQKTQLKTNNSRLFDMGQVKFIRIVWEARKCMESSSAFILSSREIFIQSENEQDKKKRLYGWWAREKKKRRRNRETRNRKEKKESVANNRIYVKRWHRTNTIWTLNFVRWISMWIRTLSLSLSPPSLSSDPFFTFPWIPSIQISLPTITSILTTILISFILFLSVQFLTQTKSALARPPLNAVNGKKRRIEKRMKISQHIWSGRNEKKRYLLFTFIFCFYLPYISHVSKEMSNFLCCSPTTSVGLDPCPVWMDS